MVAVNRKAPTGSAATSPCSSFTIVPVRFLLPVLVFLALSLACVIWVYASPIINYRSDYSSFIDARLPPTPSPELTETKDATRDVFQIHKQCPVTSIGSLSKNELEPKAGPRHMVGPPQGGKLTLVCCETTKGNFSALLHHAWAPIGVPRLVEMIQSRYFSTKVPMYRCTDACQFGYAGDPEVTTRFHGRLQDDPMWLPLGKDHQKNENGVKRYPEGFWTFAGAGPNTRSNQFVITLKPNLFMGGGSPWEVPLGEFVGKESFAILPLLYNGYGEKGPGQGLLRNEGNTERVEKEWPLMDYILSCNVIDELDAPLEAQ